MVKLIVQIPCLDEEETLPIVLADIPAHIEGLDEIEVLVIDDGSKDRTAAIAVMSGAHVVRHTGNKGLAAAFQTGLDECLRLGADIIVNTDGDHQYRGTDIPALVKPIVQGDCDIVVGNRQTRNIAHFSPTKKRLQAMGSWTMQKLSGVKVPIDAPCGFRAFSREAAMRLNVLTGYTYTLETLIQAGKKNLNVMSVPITTNRVERPSRLFKSIGSYVKRSAATMLRIWALYEPLKTFSYFAAIFLAFGLALIGRFGVLYFAAGEKGPRHVQSLIIAMIFLMIGAVIAAVALLSDSIATNRRLLEEQLRRTKELQFQIGAYERRLDAIGRSQDLRLPADD